MIQCKLDLCTIFILVHLQNFAGNSEFCQVRLSLAKKINHKLFGGGGPFRRSETMGRKNRVKQEKKLSQCPKPQEIFNAVICGNVRQLKRMKNFNANIELKNGCTPLYIAAQEGNLDVVRYLAGEAHADVNLSLIHI